jgi:hypothetical protein
MVLFSSRTKPTVSLRRVSGPILKSFKLLKTFVESADAQERFNFVKKLTETFFWRYTVDDIDKRPS